MNNIMTYKGYTARIEYDDEDKIFTGQLIGLQDIVVFHGDSVQELQTALHQSVDGYLDACQQLGQLPQTPASGDLSLSIPAELHHAALAAAHKAGTNLNQWATNLIAKATQFSHTSSP